MIDSAQAVFLAVVQGLTEFLPISSSAHLVIPSQILDWPDQGLAFDVSVHVGTLCAVLVYYRRQLITMAQDWLRTLAGGPVSADSRLVWYLGFATIPAGILGLIAGDAIESAARNLPVIATTTLVFGVLLGVADGRAGSNAAGRVLTLRIALLVGIAQAVALIPGVSRSGVTITAALFLGLDRQSAARFSFLLSIPIIVCAGGLKGWQLVQDGALVDWWLLATGAFLSGITAFLCIALFLRLLNKIGMMPFVYYRVVLAIVLYGLWLVRM